MLHQVCLDYRRKFRSQTSDNMDRWKAEMERVREKRKIRRERVRRKKMQMREKVGKSRSIVFFQWFVAQEGRKVGSLKRRVRSQLARWEMKNCTPLWREAHFQVKMYKTHQLRTIFTSWDAEKVHAVVARSTFRSQNVQKLRCRKSARHCGAKHISKSKCTKHTILGPLLEVEMSKKCTPLWREAHFQVKMYKTHHSRTTFGSWDVEKVHAVVARSTFPSENVQNHGRTTFARWDVEKVHAVVARSTFPSQNVQNTRGSDHFWKFRCRKVHAVVARSTFRSQNVQNTRGSDHFWRFRCRFASLHYTTLHYTTLHYTTLQYITLHSSTLHYTTLHSSTLHYTTLHYTTLHCTEWHCTTDRKTDRQTDR